MNKNEFIRLFFSSFIVYIVIYFFLMKKKKKDFKYFAGMVLSATAGGIVFVALSYLLTKMGW